MIHEDRRRAELFGEVANQYDRARPTYPAELVADLMVDRPHRILDVGCGTGIVSRLFTAAGAEVLGVEPDARMADVARSHGVAVEVARFEEWDAAGRTFDIVVSGQAWHWVDPAVGPHQAADVLPPGGQLAVFWNYGTHERAASAAFDRVYRAVAPDLAQCYALGTMPPPDDDRRPIEASGRFEPAATRVYEWERRYSRAEWVDQLPTHSDHRLLPAAQLDDLLAAVGQAIDALGGSVLVHYRTNLIAARRLAWT